MRCTKCGNEIDNNASFCPFCGEKTAPAAPQGSELLYQAEVKTLLKSGVLFVYRDRTEFATSAIEKKVFPYASLLAVRKGRDHIDFVMEDGRTESCPVKGESLNKAFFTIEQAARPYIEQNKSAEGTQGIRFKLHIVPPKLNSLVSGFLSGKTEGGMLYIMDDGAEYRHSTGTAETIPYRDVKAVYVAGETIRFRSYRETYRVFTSDEAIPAQVLPFVNAALAPHIAAHREALLAQGIYFQFCRENSQISVYKDRFVSSAGSEVSPIPFEDVRAVTVAGEQMEIHKTNGTSRSYPIDSEEAGRLREFLKEALAPYIAFRTEGFDAPFGLDEKIEFNEGRRVFHLLRQDGREITKEYPMDSLVTAQASEIAMDGISKAVIGNIASGLNGQQNAEERLKEINVTFTTQTGVEVLRLGSFPLGITRSSQKYEKIMEEIARLLAYLEEKCPQCELVRIEPPPVEESAQTQTEAPSAETEGAPAPAAEGEGLPTAERALQKEQFGTVIDGLMGYMATCDTPMSIAIQGDWDSGDQGFLRLVYEAVSANRQPALWLNTWQFAQVEKGQVPALLADRLISLMGGVNTEEVKDKATKVIKGIISFTPVGDKALEAVDVFRSKSSAISFENQIKQFSSLVAAKGGRVIIFVDDLNRLPAGKLMEVLDGLAFFLKCSGCIFVASVEQAAVIQGRQELEGPGYTEEQGRRYFNDLFKMPFYVPATSLDVPRYMMDNLGRLGIDTTDETAMDHYTRLALLSVGAAPKALDQLMNSFRLVKSMAAGALAGQAHLELMLFSLLCMQASYRPAYSYLVARKDQLDPVFLNGMGSGQSEVAEQAGLEGLQRSKFYDFAAAFCRAISTDGVEGISEEECRTFVNALNIAAVVAK